MNITLTHCRYTPNWTTLDALVREATDEPKGGIIGIARRDGGCDYRAPGLYDVKFRLSDGSVLGINLQIQGY